MTIEKVFAVTAPAVVAKLATEEGYFGVAHNIIHQPSFIQRRQF
jgi:hypothetical protein